MAVSRKSHIALTARTAGYWALAMDGIPSAYPSLATSCNGTDQGPFNFTAPRLAKEGNMNGKIDKQILFVIAVVLAVWLPP